MERRVPAPRRPARAALAGLAAMALAVLAGCGSDDDYVNRERPPAAIVVAVEISDQRVRVSPASFGAGPVTLVIANRSGSAQQVTLETAEETDGPPGVRPVETGPISPRETASVQASLEEGTYALRVGAQDGDVRPAQLRVGAERPSAQNALLLP